MLLAFGIWHIFLQIETACVLFLVTLEQTNNNDNSYNNNNNINNHNNDNNSVQPMFLTTFFVLLRWGNRRNIKTTLIQDSLQLTMEHLHLIFSRLDWVCAIWGAFLRVPVNCILFSLPNGIVSRRLVVSVGVQKIFLGSCFAVIP